ncbi:MAG: helix-turn-helix transcriptional regulator [Clostridia bacterium]|nr:helix-turn-helix transcriptional regulator [Clostridia bacterium]
MKSYEIIRMLREDNDKKQEEIAKLLGIDQSYYSKYERGIRPFTAEQIRKLSLYFKVSADYLLGLPKGLNHPER